MNTMTLTMNPSIDISTEIKQLMPGKKLRCNNPAMEAGGGGINVASVIHELGGKATAIYVAGGATGQLLEKLIEAKGIDHQGILIEGRTRENITLNEQSSNQLYRLIMPGPTVQEKEQHKCLETLNNRNSYPDYMVISGSLPPGVPAEFYRRVIRKMKTQDTKIILDTKAHTLKEAAKEGVFLLKPNMNELKQLAGKELNEEVEQEHVARELIKNKYAEIIVVSLGAAGILVVSETLNERLRAPSVPIKSRVGAGDSMVAGITLALSEGWSVKDAVKFGIAAGSAAVMTPGTQLCKREDVERLYSQLK